MDSFFSIIILSLTFVTLGYTSGYLQVRGVDNYLPVSPLAMCECRAGIWVKEKGNRLEVYLTRRCLVYL
jgi:hypothetical protein